MLDIQPTLQGLHENGAARYRVEVRQSPDPPPRLPWVVDLYQREGDDWRHIVAYCYADPALALTEAALMVAAYQRAVIAVQHNIGEVSLG